MFSMKVIFLVVVHHCNSFMLFSLNLSYCIGFPEISHLKRPFLTFEIFSHNDKANRLTISHHLQLPFYQDYSTGSDLNHRCKPQISTIQGLVYQSYILSGDGRWGADSARVENGALRRFIRGWVGVCGGNRGRAISFPTSKSKKLKSNIPFKVKVFSRSVVKCIFTRVIFHNST